MDRINYCTLCGLFAGFSSPNDCLCEECWNEVWRPKEEEEDDDDT